MTNILSFLYVIFDWDWLRKFPATISIFTNDIRDQIMTAGTKRYKVICNGFMRNFRIARWTMMDIQLKARAIFITKATTIAIHLKAGFAFDSPFNGVNVIDVIHCLLYLIVPDQVQPSLAKPFHHIYFSISYSANAKSRYLSGLPICLEKGRFSQKIAALHRQIKTCRSSLDAFSITQKNPGVKKMPGREPSKTVNRIIYNTGIFQCQGWK